MPAVYTVEVPRLSSLAAFKGVDFQHACGLRLPRDSSASAVYWAELMFDAPPRTLRVLMRGRDLLVRPLGLKPVIRTAASPTVGPFALISLSDEEVVFGQDDRHLDFRCSVLVDEVDGARQVVCATVVRVHSAIGRAYLAAIRVAHPRLTAMLLSRAAMRAEESSV